MATKSMDLGQVMGTSAYQEAQAGGYTGTKAEFQAQLAAIANKAAKALSFTVTLTAAGWSGNAQTVSNSNFAAIGYAYTVCPASGSYEAYANAIIYADDVTTEGKMTFHCSEKPTANLTVSILRVEVEA